MDGIAVRTWHVGQKVRCVQPLPEDGLPVGEYVIDKVIPFHTGTFVSVVGIAAVWFEWRFEPVESPDAAQP